MEKSRKVFKPNLIYKLKEKLGSKYGKSNSFFPPQNMATLGLFFPQKNTLGQVHMYIYIYIYFVKLGTLQYGAQQLRLYH
jgi:hypothetical protein